MQSILLLTHNLCRLAIYNSDLETQEEFGFANKVCMWLFLRMGNGTLAGAQIRVRSKVPGFIAIVWRITYNTTTSLSYLGLPRLVFLEM